jgi:hypothetical protein
LPNDTAGTWNITPIRYEPDDLISLGDREEYPRLIGKLAESLGVPARYFGPSPTGDVRRFLTMADANEQMLDEMLRQGGVPGSRREDR